MLPLVILLPALTLAGLIILTIFFTQFIRDNSRGVPLDIYPMKLGIPTLVVFASLILQRLIPMAVLFLIAVLVIALLIVIHSRVAARAAARQPAAPQKPARLVQLEQYKKHIPEKALLKRVLKLQGIVASIRTVVGYDKKTLELQSADIRKMETIYLPRIESLLNNYVKVSAHDKAYDSRGLMESLDTITQGIKKIQADCLDQDKLSIDVEASALISAMELDGLSEDTNQPRQPRENKRP